jgi:hypothetical protein
MREHGRRAWPAVVAWKPGWLAIGTKSAAPFEGLGLRVEVEQPREFPTRKSSEADANETETLSRATASEGGRTNADEASLR